MEQFLITFLLERKYRTKNVGTESNAISLNQDKVRWTISTINRF